MLDPLFSRMLKRHAIPMNRRIMEGMATTGLDFIEEYLDAQIRSIWIGMPDCFEYVGYERCQPDEEFAEISKERSGNKRSFDIADSSLYLVKYYFVFTDKMGKKHEFVRYINLPYVSQAGIITISGTQYHLIPLLSDKVFTPGDSSVFVRLTQDRNNMFRMYNTVMVNGRRETRYVVWATIYRSPDAKKASSGRRPRTLLIHYLLGKYGFTEVFRKYTGVVPVVGYEHDITPEKYPPEDWVICHSTKQKPNSCLEKSYRASTVRLAIRKDEYSPAVESMIFGLFYILDHFPDRFELRRINEHIDKQGEIHHLPPEAVDPVEKQRYLLRCLDDVALWKILIGVMVLPEGRGENTLHREISGHFETLDAYLDNNSQQKLQEKNIFLENYYDLLNYVAQHFNAMVLSSDDNGLCVYGKNLEILSHVLYDILYGFTTMKFNLNKAANRRELTKKDITSNLNNYVKMGAAFKLHSGKIITKAVSYSGDHMYPGITAVIAEQENRAGVNRGQTDRVVVGKRHYIDLSMITTGSVLNLPKANPTPLARVNPWITLDEATGTVIPNPKFEKLLAENRKFFKF